MRPEDNQQIGRVGTPQVPQRSFVHTPPSRNSDYSNTDQGSGAAINPQQTQQDAATNVIRSQIDSIYNRDPNHTETTSEAPQPQAPQQQVAPQQNIDTNPYERTHTQNRTIQADQWKQYHSAWQEYYQKYYEGYYAHHLQKAKTELHSSQPQQATPQHDDATKTLGSGPRTDGPVSRREAVDDLKQRLLGTVQSSAQKARKSRHFVPAAAAFGVVIIFLFLQFNQVIVSNVKAYVSPGSIDPENIIVAPDTTAEVSDESRLIIPKINVDAPVFYDVGIDNDSQMAAMENGIAHFPIAGASSHPGEVGNTVLSGHSSNDVFAAGDFKFIFMQLDKLQEGDVIYANYKGTRYTYSVTKKEVVLPTEVNKLTYETDKPVMTLITCTPLGTAEKRLLVTAEQISPDPTTADKAPDDGADAAEESSIPGQGEPTLLERVFGS